MNYSEAAYQKAFFLSPNGLACNCFCLFAFSFGQGGGDGGRSEREMLGILLWSSGWPST